LSALPSAPVYEMRDESKSAIVGVSVLILPILLLAIINPSGWRFKVQTPVPAPVRHPVDNSAPPGRLDEFVARYGPPTLEEQNGQGELKPPMYTRWLDYEPEHLRVAFVAAESSEGSHWVRIAFVDSTGPVPISEDEAGRRLISRQR
jgi:hypothetical protein